MPHLSRPEFDLLVRRAGLSLSDEQLGQLHEAWSHAEPMIERVRAQARGREAEPAPVFLADLPGEAA